MIVGLFYSNLVYESSFGSEEVKQSYEEFIISVKFQDTFLGNFVFISSRNIVASAFRIVVGIAGGLIPVIYVIIDGLSNAHSLVFSTIDNGIEFTLFGFLPHSILEIPSMILVSSLGGYDIFIAIQIRRKAQECREGLQGFTDSFPNNNIASFILICDN